MDDYSDAPSLPANAVTAADEIDLPGILAELGPEVADIVETCLAGGNPTQAQRDRANQGIDRKIDETFDAAKENAKEKLRIKPNDSRSRIIAITQIAASFLNFLGRLQLDYRQSSLDYKQDRARHSVVRAEDKIFLSRSVVLATSMIVVVEETVLLIL